MAQNHSKLIITYKDYDKEAATITVQGAPVLDDGTNFVAILAAMDAVEAAFDALVLGVKTQVTRVFQCETFEFVRPSKQAQRECRLFIGGHNFSTFDPKKLTLGTFDLDELAAIPAGEDLPSYVDLSAGNGLALKTALEAYWTDVPTYLISVIVDRAVHTGANT